MRKFTQYLKETGLPHDLANIMAVQNKHFPQGHTGGTTGGGRSSSSIAQSIVEPLVRKAAQEIASAIMNSNQRSDAVDEIAASWSGRYLEMELNRLLGNIKGR